MVLDPLNYYAAVVAGLDIPDVVEDVPEYSLDFERDNGSYLSMSDADFGSFDRAKFAISARIYVESLPFYIFAKGSTVTTLNGFSLHVTSAGNLEFITFASGGLEGRLRKDAVISTGQWYHIMAHYDSANATAGDRMKMWLAGSEITSFDVDTNPSNPVGSESDNINVGRNTDDSSGLSDGLLYQPAIFSGVLPTIDQVYHPSTGAPRNVKLISGIKSMLDVAGGDVTNDALLGVQSPPASWTNNATGSPAVQASVIIPT